MDQVVTIRGSREKKLVSSPNFSQTHFLFLSLRRASPSSNEQLEGSLCLPLLPPLPYITRDALFYSTKIQYFHDEHTSPSRVKEGDI